MLATLRLPGALPEIPKRGQLHASAIDLDGEAADQLVGDLVVPWGK